MSVRESITEPSIFLNYMIANGDIKPPKPHPKICFISYPRSFGARLESDPTISTTKVNIGSERALDVHYCRTPTGTNYSFGFVEPQYGGAMAEMTMRELAGLGFSVFIGLGTNGYLTDGPPDHQVGTMFLPQNAIHFGDPIVPYLDLKSIQQYYDFVEGIPSLRLSTRLLTDISEIMKEEDIGYETTDILTTGAFYGTTPRLIRWGLERNARAIDMEASINAAVAKEFGLQYALMVTATDVCNANQEMESPWNWDSRNEAIRKRHEEMFRTSLSLVDRIESAS